MPQVTNRKSLLLESTETDGKLIGWWKADNGITVDGSTRVIEWRPILGSTSLFQPTASKRPLLVSAQWNGRNSVYFDGTRALRSVSNITIPLPSNIFIVGNPSNGDLIYEQTPNAFSTAGGGSWLITSNAPATLVGRVIGNGSTYNYTYGAPTDGNLKLFTHQLTTTHATQKVRVNRVDYPMTAAGFTANPGAASQTGIVYVGSRNDGASLFMTGYISEILITSSLTATQLSDIEKYLAVTYGMDRGGEGCMLGDSIIADNGVGQAAVKTFIFSTAEDPVSARIIVLAISGARVDQQETTWNGGGLLGSPKGTSNLLWASIQCGLNDIEQGASSATVLTRLQSLVNNIRAANPSAKILVGHLTPTSKVSVPQATRNAVNTGISTLTNVDAVVSSYMPILDDGFGALKLIYDSGDTVHPNNAGRQVIADSYRATLASFGFV